MDLFSLLGLIFFLIMALILLFLFMVTVYTQYTSTVAKIATLLIGIFLSGLVIVFWRDIAIGGPEKINRRRMKRLLKNHKDLEWLLPVISMVCAGAVVVYELSNISERITQPHPFLEEGKKSGKNSYGSIFNFSEPISSNQPFP